MKYSRYSNKQEITNIYVIEEDYCTFYYYQPYEKTFWGGTKKEGIYQVYTNEFKYSINDLPHPYILNENKNVVKKPSVTIEYSSGKSDFTKYFDTFWEAEQYANSLMDVSRANYIKLS